MKRLLMTRSGRTRRSAIMLTRYPRAGGVKTRIAADLGDEVALDLHDRLARHTLKQLLALQACNEARVEVRSDAAFVHATREWLGRGPRYRYQGEGDLGRKLQLAFAEAFARGEDHVVVVGSDCPSLRAHHLRQALDALQTADVVIGPASDGGYYLIGVSRRRQDALAGLFGEIPWGSSDVLAQTRNSTSNMGLSTFLLEQLSDVDRAEDVELAEQLLAAEKPSPGDRASVVIPVLQDAALVADAVDSANHGGAHEVIVVDGGSTDGTPRVAREAGARTLVSAPGRATQMNAGAALAEGEVLCFLHADTVLPDGFSGLVSSALADPSRVAAAFDFRVPEGGWRHGVINAVGGARWRLTRLPYGDQAVCVRRSVFEALGGFPEMPTMEDYELGRRLKRYGEIGRIPRPALTSSRAWDDHGLLGSTAVNVATIAAYRLGVSPERLAHWRATIAPRSRPQVPADTRGDGRS